MDFVGETPSEKRYNIKIIIYIYIFFTGIYLWRKAIEKESAVNSELNISPLKVIRSPTGKIQPGLTIYNSRNWELVGCLDDL